MEKSPDAPETMWSDPQRVQQILRNLMSNAIKFTHKGAVQLTVSTEQVDEPERSGKWLVFSVKDTGIGIPADKHHSILKLSNKLMDRSAANLAAQDLACPSAGIWRVCWTVQFSLKVLKAREVPSGFTFP